jgi:hypothetical protein
MDIGLPRESGENCGKSRVSHAFVSMALRQRLPYLIRGRPNSAARPDRQGVAHRIHTRQRLPSLRLATLTPTTNQQLRREQALTTPARSHPGDQGIHEKPTFSRELCEVCLELRSRESVVP